MYWLRSAEVRHVTYMNSMTDRLVDEAGSHLLDLMLSNNLTIRSGLVPELVGPW